MSDPRGTVFTIGELASYLKISKSTLYKLAQAGGLPGVKVGRHWRFHREAVDVWLMRNPKRGAGTGRKIEHRG
jgi:excisionase family DNA binding protein